MQLKKNINICGCKMEKKVNNIKELAEKIGLSPTTVSRVLNGKSKVYRISPVTSQKVLSAARKYKYSPNQIARGLKNGEDRNPGTDNTRYCQPVFWLHIKNY